MSTIAMPVERTRARPRIGRVPREQRKHRERGDVPGWVLVTLMTAGLVIALWAIAGPALVDVFQTAIDRVTGV
ncbi:MAG TPA: hypothetical protein VFC48_00240 [Cellulomonas sp.]|nr:hypothetical protein [Cellulomonas sp.]